MRAPLAVCRQPAGGPEQAAKCAVYFINIKRNITYSNPCSTHPHRGIWKYQKYTPNLAKDSQICYTTPILYTAATFVKYMYCYTTGCWLFCL